MVVLISFQWTAWLDQYLTGVLFVVQIFIVQCVHSAVQGGGRCGTDTL